MIHQTIHQLIYQLIYQRPLQLVSTPIVQHRGYATFADRHEQKKFHPRLSFDIKAPTKPAGQAEILPPALPECVLGHGATLSAAQGCCHLSVAHHSSHKNDLARASKSDTLWILAEGLEMHDANASRIDHCTIHLLIENDYGSLPRILLQFARRQLKIQALHFFDLEPPRLAELQIDLACSADIGRQLLDDLSRLECVNQALLEDLVIDTAKQPKPQANFDTRSRAIA